jgi:nucleoside-diphosphate-sugar epimerase
MRTVLVLGAGGRFGQAAVHAFAQAGWHVLAQLRRAPATAWPANVTVLTVPLSDTDALASAAAGASAVVYAVNPPYTAWDTQALPLFRLGLAVAHTLDATFMLPGNVYNFGSTLPAVLREDTPQRADHGKARIRITMETEMRDAAQHAARQDRGLRCVVIRAGDFFGCGSGSWLDQVIVKDLARGLLAYPGPLGLQHAWAYLPDLANAFERVAAQPNASRFECLHFAGHNLTGQELLAAVDAAAAGLGMRPAQGFRVGGMPWGLIRAVGLVYPMWRELARMRYLWQQAHALAGDQLAARVALPPPTPLIAALHQSLLDLGLALPASPAAAPS